MKQNSSNMFLILIFAIFLGNQYVVLSTDCGRVSYNKLIQNVSFFRVKIEGVPASNKLHVNYFIQIKQQPCCAAVSFLTNNTLNESHIDTVRRCYKKGVRQNVLASQYLIFLSHGNPTAGCERNGMYYDCRGTRMLYFEYTVEWYLQVGYECGREQTLNVTIELELECDFQTRCEPVEFPYCRDAFNYSHTSFPNMLGQVSQFRANTFLNIITLVMNELLTCHQKAKQSICFALFPPCINGKRVVPCHKLCEELKTACTHTMERYNQAIYCGTFPSSTDPDICHYEHVTCPMLKDPDFGRLTYKGRYPFNSSEYICNKGYYLKGNQARFCMFSGNWNGTEPICIQNQEIVSKAMIIGTVSATVVVISIAIILLCNLKDVRLMLFHSRQNMIYQVAQGKGQLFLTYSSEDQEIVENQLLPTLKFELPAWEILTYQENFIGGQKLLDSIHKGIWESNAVLAFLTKNYIDSHWCRYEFGQGQTRSATDNMFKFIIIIPENGPNEKDFFADIPENIRTWVKGRVYLQVGERLFWNKLRRALNQ